MRHILERLATLVVIALSVLLCAGCSGPFGGPHAQANDAIGQTNEAIAKHNRLFREARATYDESRKAIEAGKDPTDQAKRIAQARRTLQEARSNLEQARKSLSEVQGLKVESGIKEYARLLSQAMGTQIEAEAREADFYEVLQGDPILTRDRQKALKILSDAGNGYQRAEQTYGRAQKVADSNPKLLRKG